MIARASSFLNCPRCGLSIQPKVSWMTVEYCPRFEYCPRCMARARIPVKLFSSTLPAAQLYPEGSMPTAEYQGMTTTIPTTSRR
jgi:hypothetical protein